MLQLTSYFVAFFSPYSLSMLSRLLSLLLLLLSAYSALAQGPGRLAGRVSGPGGKALEGVSVVDQAGRYTTLTDGTGHFVLDKLPLGEYTLLTRSLGYEESQQRVTLSAEQPSATVNFVLAASTNAVQEVEVLGRKETTYKSD